MGWGPWKGAMEKGCFQTILKVLVGSKAHGLTQKESDHDYRGVFVSRTRDLVKLHPCKQDTQWLEGDKDSTYYEVRKFFLLATKGLPTMLEVFFAPVVFETQYGADLRAMVGQVWNSEAVKNAFIGYGRNQQKKFLENKDGLAHKYAAAHLRVLYNGYQLLSTRKEFDVSLRGSPVYEKVKKFKRGDFSPGEVVQECWEWEQKLLEAYRTCPDKKTNVALIDDFLFKIRKDFW